MATTESLTLSSAQQEQFERDGYVVIDPGISDDVIESVKRELDGRYITDGPQVLDEYDVKYRPGRNPAIQEAWKIFKPVREIALAPKVLDSLRELYGREPYPAQTINFPFGSEQHAHADGMLFNSFPIGYMCGVWVALEDVDMENGPLVYYPGSHKLPIPEADDLADLDPDDFNSFDEFVDERSRQYSPFVKKQIEENDLQPKYGTDEERPGARVGGTPAARRIAAKGCESDAPQPGDPLLLRRRLQALRSRFSADRDGSEWRPRLSPARSSLLQDERACSGRRRSPMQLRAPCSR